MFSINVIGTDCASSIHCKTKKKSELKAYILVAKCLGNINKDQKFHDLLSSGDDCMEFNVPKAP